MAIGDAALAAGFQLVSGTTAASQIDDEINRLADWVAERTAKVTPVKSGGTGAETAAAARANLGITASNIPAGGGTVQGDLNYLGSRVDRTYDQPSIDRAFAQRDASIASASGGAAEALRGNLWTDSYNRQINGNRRAAWLQDNGQLGHTASSERYKKYIRAEDVTDDQVLTLTLVSYQWRAAVAVDDRREMGLIAERLVEAGLGWACFFNEDGTVEGINYDHVVLTLIPAIRRLIIARADIEARLARLEASNA